MSETTNSPLQLTGYGAVGSLLGLELRCRWFESNYPDMELYSSLVKRLVLKTNRSAMAQGFKSL